MTHRGEKTIATNTKNNYNKIKVMYVNSSALSSVVTVWRFSNSYSVDVSVVEEIENCWVIWSFGGLK